MIKTVLYRPVLWLRKIIVYFLVILILLGLLLYVAANSPWVIKKVADTYAPAYKLSYSRIHGSVFTGIEVEDLSYNHEPMAKHITLKWNPNGLIQKKIMINTLKIEKVNVDTIKTFVTSFGSSDVNASDSEANRSKEGLVYALMPQWVYVDSVEIDTLPFVYTPVDIRALRFRGRDAVFDIEKLVLQKASFDVQSSTNLSDLHYKTKVKENKLIGQVEFKPKKALFELYELPVRREAVGKIVLDLNVSKEEVITDLRIEMKQVLKAEKDAFNLDIDNLHMYVVYDIKEKRLKAKSNVLLTTPYAKDVLVTNLFTMDEKIAYSGEIHVPQIIGIDAKFVKPLKHLKLIYEGDAQRIRTNIESDNVKGTFISEGFKKADLHLENKEVLNLNEFLSLPKELNQTKANMVIDAPLSFEQNASLLAYVKISSNVVNIDANLSYKEKLEIKTLTNVPKESLLRVYNETVKWDSLTPFSVNLDLLDARVHSVLKGGKLAAEASYNLHSTKTEGEIRLNGLHADISGSANQNLSVHTQIDSIASLVQSVQEVYALEEIPSVKGSADISFTLADMKSVNIEVKSPEILYEADRKITHYVNDIDLSMQIDEEQCVINRYALSYAGQKLFSTKPSILTFSEGNVTIDPLWLNDALKIVGKYDIKSKKGNIDTEAKKLHIGHEVIDLDSSVDIKTVLDGNKTSINGNIILLGGNIHYDLGQKTFASDSDIVIVQDIKETKERPFMDNLSTLIQIKTQKPLLYKKDAVNIKADVDLSVYKAEHSELMVLGSVTIHKGGSYTFEGKKFMLEKSDIYFTGNVNKPLIEASVTYKALNHLITIAITGSADMPTINFSSKPALSKEQILSIILFDSEEGAGTNTGEDMMKMMGGSMAKSALSNLGVQLDHLVLGSGNSVEVGKKLTDKVTVIYVNDTISSVKLIYEHGVHTQSVLGVSEASQSYDIIYKRDY